MKPDEKYMKNKNNTSDTDLNLVPFKGGNNQFNMPQAGWIPVYFFGNTGFNNNIASSMGLPSPMSSNMMQPGMNNKNMQGFNNMQNPNNMQGFNNMQNPNNMQGFGNTQSSNNQNTMKDFNNSQGSNTVKDFNNPNTFPDESSGENLYSYNTSNNSNTTNPNYNSNNPTAPSTDRNKPNILNILRDLNIDLDEDNDLVRHCSDKRIDKIYDKIEKNNPEVMGVLETYEMPCPIAKVLIRKIIKLTLNHCKRDGD